VILETCAASIQPLEGSLVFPGRRAQHLGALKEALFGFDALDAQIVIVNGHEPEQQDPAAKPALADRNRVGLELRVPGGRHSEPGS
jgi:hypothetical protein